MKEDEGSKGQAGWLEAPNSIVGIHAQADVKLGVLVCAFGRFLLSSIDRSKAVIVAVHRRITRRGSSACCLVQGHHGEGGKFSSST